MNFDNAVQIYAPDKQKLAELVIKAKGNKRTMAQFAIDTGISAPTLSRISNGKISNPLTKEILEKIFEARCEEADFTFDILLMANGMVDSQRVESEKAYTERYISVREQRITLERHAKNAVINAVLDRGISVQSIPSDFDRTKAETPFGMYLRSDFGLYVPSENHQLWYFNVVTDARRFAAGSGGVFAQAARLFILDSWVPEFLVNQKYSFIFDNEMIYYRFINQYKGAPIKNAITAILFDPQTEQIIKETWMSDSPEIPSIFAREITSRGEISTWIDEEDDED